MNRVDPRENLSNIDRICHIMGFNQKIKEEYKNMIIYIKDKDTLFNVNF